MTWLEIRAWAISHGWQHNRLDPNVLRHESRIDPNVWLYLRAQARTVRVYIIPKTSTNSKDEVRICTAYYTSIIMSKEGIPVGLHLGTTHHSPHFHKQEPHT